jgi:twitching motility protein PilJ
MNQKNHKHARGRSLMVFILTALLISSMAFVAITFFQLIRNAKFEQEWVSLATDVQVSSQQLAKSAGEAASGNLEAFAELSTAYERMTSAMNILRNGSPAIDLPPAPDDVGEQMAQLNSTWDRMSVNAASITERENLLLSMAEASMQFSSLAPEVQESTDRVVRQLTESGAPNQQVFAASRQLVLADRMLRHVTEILQGGTSAVSGANALQSEITLFDRVSSALLNGSTNLGITQVRNQQALTSLKIPFAGNSSPPAHTFRPFWILQATCSR